MTDALLYVYLGGWVLTSTLALLTASRARRSRWLSVVAGAVWPLLVVAVAQMAAIAAIATLLRTTSADSAGAVVASHLAPTFVKTV